MCEGKCKLSIHPSMHFVVVESALRGDPHAHLEGPTHTGATTPFQFHHMKILHTYLPSQSAFLLIVTILIAISTEQ